MPLLSTIGAAAARAFGFLRALVTGGYNVANSLRFDVGSSDYLQKALTGVDGNRQIWTFSCWVKRSVLGTAQTIFSFGENLSSEGNLYFDANDFLVLLSDFQNGSSNETDMKFRDVGAWYHIVWACDSTQATNADRWKVYVNGTQVTLTGSPTITLNGNGIINAWAAHDCWIGANARSQQSGNPPQYSGLYLSETYFIDGQQKQASDFGETDEDTGIWKPKAYTGTYGTNGFYLQFKNSSSLGTDSSGNGNNFTVNNLTSVDQTTDTPTNNFATINTLTCNDTATLTSADGNLTITGGNDMGATIGITKGKWYWESKRSNTGSAAHWGIGFTQSWNSSTQIVTGNGSGIWIRDDFVGGYNVNNSGSNGFTTISGSTTGSSIANGDIVGIALDLDSATKSITFYQNGSSVGSGTFSYDGTSSVCFPFVRNNSGVQSQWNFGNPPYSANSYQDANGFGNFSYSVPSGYYALCTKNLYQYGF